MPVAWISTLTALFLLIVTSGNTNDPEALRGTGTPSIDVTRRELAGLSVLGSTGVPLVTNAPPAVNTNDDEIWNASRRTIPVPPLPAAPPELPPAPATFSVPPPAKTGATRRMPPPLPPPPRAPQQLSMPP